MAGKNVMISMFFVVVVAYIHCNYVTSVHISYIISLNKAQRAHCLWCMDGAFNRTPSIFNQNAVQWKIYDLVIENMYQQYAFDIFVRIENK